MTCKEFEEIAGAYALDAVTSEEREAARAHLGQCQSCARLYGELRSVVALLPLSVPQVDPPVTLEGRVFSAIRREVVLSQQPTQNLPGINVQRPQRTRRQSWLTRTLAIAAVLLFVLVGGIGALGFSLRQQLTGANSQLAHVGQQLANAEQQMVSTQQQLTSTKQQLSDTKHQLASVSPRLIATIKGNATTNGATGQLFYLPQQNITVLIMYGLPQPRGSRIYQGWVLHGSQPTSIGLLTMLGNTATLSFPGNVTGYNLAAISLEPGPAASKNAPIGPVIAVGKL